MIIWTKDVSMAADFHSAGALIHVRKLKGQPPGYEIVWEAEQREPARIQTAALRARQRIRQNDYWTGVLKENCHEALSDMGLIA